MVTADLVFHYLTLVSTPRTVTAIQLIYLDIQSTLVKEKSLEFILKLNIVRAVLCTATGVSFGETLTLYDLYNSIVKLFTFLDFRWYMNNCQGYLIGWETFWDEN